MLDVCGVHCYGKESFAVILTHISFAQGKEGLQTFLWLSAAACVWLSVVIYLEEGCLG